jgi:uncharacterized protein
VSVTAERLFEPVESLEGIKVIDVDTHLTEPADLWSSRAPEKYASRVPRVVMPGEMSEAVRQQTAALSGGHSWGGPQKRPVWVVDEDTLLGPAGAGSVVNKDNEKVKGAVFLEWPLSESSPAGSYIVPRLAMMDELGIWAQIMFPNVVGFGGQEIIKVKDPVLRDLCSTIWNDAMAEMQQESGGRICGQALLPWWDVKASVREIERIHALGLKGVITNADPQNQGFPDLAQPHWNPVWEALEGLGLPLNFHIGASATQRSYFGPTPWPSLDNNVKLAIGSSVLQLGNARVVANMIFSGICERFPNLKIVSVESGIGWIPFMLQAMDYQAAENGVELPMKPSEYFHRQIYACFWFESGTDLIQDIERIGIDNCLFETDFPHPTCLFPEPLRYVASALEEADDGFRRKVLSTNAAKVYNFDVPE